jgi:hypothetical protein
MRKLSISARPWAGKTAGLSGEAAFPEARNVPASDCRTNRSVYRPVRWPTININIAKTFQAGYRSGESQARKHFRNSGADFKARRGMNLENLLCGDWLRSGKKCACRSTWCLFPAFCAIAACGKRKSRGWWISRDAGFRISVRTIRFRRWLREFSKARRINLPWPGFRWEVAMEVLAKAQSRVTRLALLSTNPGGILPQVRSHYLSVIEGIEAGKFDAYLADAFPRYVAPDRAGDEALWKTYRDMAKRLGPEVGVRQMRALLDYKGFGAQLSTITCPLALIFGREDRRTPVDAMGNVGGATVCVIEKAGHFTPLEQPEAVSAALRAWLPS